MILRKYLTEVAFKNGSEEFKSYRDYFKKQVITQSENGSQTIKIVLAEKEVDVETLVIEIEGKYDIPVYWRKVNGSSLNELEIYVTDSNLFLEGDVLETSYVALNEAVSNLYSVDYETGVLYLAAETNVPLDIEYQFYNTMVTAKKATQLEPDAYVTTSADATINNYKSDSSYRLVFSVKQDIKEEYTTPVIKNLKVNYLNTNEKESF